MARDQHLTVEGDLVSRSEFFDEADLDAALARFDELSRPTPKLENAASQVRTNAPDASSRRATGTRWRRCWPTTSSVDDRRHVVTPASPRSRSRDRGRASNRRPRGHDNDSDRHCDPRRAPRPHACSRFRAATDLSRFNVEILNVVEIDADERIAAVVVFDPDDSTPPSRSSTPATSPAKPPPTRTHGRSSRGPTPRLNRREIPANDAGLGEHRPPARSSVRAR